MPVPAALIAAAPYIASGVSALAGWLGSRGNDKIPHSAEMEQLLRLQNRRMEMANPLYEALLRMAFGMVPSGAREGLGITGWNDTLGTAGQVRRRPLDQYGTDPRSRRG